MPFICANPDVTVVIPGMYSPAEVAENVAAAEDATPLTSEEQAQLRIIRNAQIADHAAFVRPLA